MNLSKLAGIFLITFAAFALSGCEQSAVEEAGDNIEDAAENASDAVSDAADSAGDAVEDVADKVD